MTSDIICPSDIEWQPIERTAGIPLRVAVYNEIARVIRLGVLRRGQAIPREPDLCVVFAVSRTVMREALILLEEDGLIRTKRGVGRFVADELPVVGLERTRPIEDLFPDSAMVTVTPLTHRVEDVADFSQRLPESRALFVESLVGVGVGAEPFALVQEWAGLEWLQRRIPHVVEAENRRTSSLLSQILETSRSALTAARSDFTVSHAGEERSKHLRLRPMDPVLLISQIIETSGGPCYLAKVILGPNASHIPVNQSLQ